MLKENRLAIGYIFLLLCIFAWAMINKSRQPEKPLKRYRCCAAINMYDPPCLTFESKTVVQDIYITFNETKIDAICRERK